MVSESGLLSPNGSILKEEDGPTLLTFSSLRRLSLVSWERDCLRFCSSMATQSPISRHSSWVKVHTASRTALMLVTVVRDWNKHNKSECTRREFVRVLCRTLKLAKVITWINSRQNFGKFSIFGEELFTQAKMHEFRNVIRISDGWFIMPCWSKI